MDLVRYKDMYKHLNRQYLKEYIVCKSNKFRIKLI